MGRPANSALRIILNGTMCPLFGVICCCVDSVTTTHIDDGGEITLTKGIRWQQLHCCGQFFDDKTIDITEIKQTKLH